MQRVAKVLHVWWLSRNRPNQRPYSLTGAIQHISLQEAPKYIRTDRNFGTLEAVNMEGLHPTKQFNGKSQDITLINHSDSDGTVPMKQ